MKKVLISSLIFSMFAISGAVLLKSAQEKAVDDPLVIASAEALAKDEDMFCWICRCNGGDEEIWCMYDWEDFLFLSEYLCGGNVNCRANK